MRHIWNRNTIPMKSHRFAFLLATVPLLTPPALAQFHQKRSFHASLGAALGGHSTTSTFTFHVLGVDFSKTQNDGAATFTIPVQVGYGLSDAFSLGFFLEPGNYIDSNLTRTNGLFLYGIEPRFYAVNKERFAWMLGLQLGGTALRITDNGGGKTKESRYSGSVFGMGTALLFGLSDRIDLQLHFRYIATRMPLRSYSEDGKSVSTKDFSGELRTSGVAAQLGAGFRF